MDEEQPPVLQQSNLVDPMKWLKETMRAAGEQRQRQAKPPPKPKSQQIKVTNNKHKQQSDQNMVENQFSQAILAMLTQGRSFT
jgi:hypothetical protein